jgi:prevent-host-death family protein
MKTIGVRDLRQNASRVLRDAERGETIQVTDRGRPVALITPLRGRDALEELRAAGDLSEANGSLADLPPPLRIPPTSVRPSKTLARLRAHER